MWRPGRQQRWARQQSLAQTGLYTPAEIADLTGTSRNSIYKSCAGLPYRVERPRKFYDDIELDPPLTTDCLPTDAPPGSAEKIEIMRRRVELGQPVRHIYDRCDCDGLNLGKEDSEHRNQTGIRLGNIKICPMPRSGGKAFS